MTRLVPKFALAIALGALSLSHPRSAAAHPAPWTAAERAAAADALVRTGDGTLGEALALDDDALSQRVLRMASRELGQRILPESIDRRWAIQPLRRDVASELSAARAAGALPAWLKDLSPPFPAYAALERAEIRYRGLVARGGWARLPAGGVLRPGTRGAEVSALRQRLAVEGYAAVAPDPAVFDAGLKNAMAGFQALHGLTADGVVGPATRAALDVPADARLQQIEANLERWRWLPRPLPRDRVEVDTGAATVTMLQDDCQTLAMKGVVGAPDKATPMFASKIQAITLNPPWKVPANIARAEILPKAARNPNYLADNDFIFLNGKLEQKAGPKSALGQVKFELPSPFGVYLHDTPSKAAFGRPRRNLSHGCMRLEKPVELAALMLAKQGWSKERLEAEIASGRTETIPLRAPVPLFVFYWTASVALDGQVSLLPDVYGWDRKLYEALAAATP